MKEKIGNYRWSICALLFFATTLSYVDRQVFAILAPTLEKEIGWSEIEYGYLVSIFQVAYALGLFLVGRFIDKVGVKLGYSLSIVVWSIAEIGHALVKSVLGFGIARFTLAIGESGNFPAAIKTVAEWFPKKERALATGIFNSGANIGVIVTAIIVPWLTIRYSWQAPFVVTGFLGIIWVVFWIFIYNKPEHHKKLRNSELTFIKSNDDEIPRNKIIPVKSPWLKLLLYKQSWSYIVAKFLTEPAWWFYLGWLPKFFNKKYGLDLAHLGLPLIIIYSMACVGSIGAGWFSGHLIKRGFSINKARKLALLTCAVLVIPIIFASNVPQWLGICLIGLAAAAHQGWSANLYTVCSDMFPKNVVASIVGLGSTIGAFGSMSFAVFAGFMLEFTGSYMYLFVICGFLYIIAFILFCILVPGLEPMKMEGE